MNEREQRQMRQAGGDAFSAAFELIMTPALFGLLGWFIDSRAGLFPVFTLSLGFTVFAYEVWRLWAQYSLAMDTELAARRANYGQVPTFGQDANLDQGAPS